jgi:hypothetical protein
MVEQGLMFFVFQQDLGVQLQRALNMERYEIATKIRERRQRVGSSFLAIWQDLSRPLYFLVPLY